MRDRDDERGRERQRQKENKRTLKERKERNINNVEVLNWQRLSTITGKTITTMDELVSERVSEWRAYRFIEELHIPKTSLQKLFISVFTHFFDGKLFARTERYGTPNILSYTGSWIRVKINRIRMRPSRKN